jgi:hypothetical protein
VSEATRRGDILEGVTDGGRTAGVPGSGVAQAARPTKATTQPASRETPVRRVACAATDTPGRVPRGLAR